MSTPTSIDNSSRLLVFGGPYSNLPATKAMQKKAIELDIKPHNIICTGDVVAYGAEPEETSEVIRNWGIHVVAGNCEEQLAEGAQDCGCGFEEGSVCEVLSRGWYPFANAGISDETRAWMAGLPSFLSFEYAARRIRVIHGGSRQTNRFIFASDREALREETSTVDADIVLAGHAGIPFIEKVHDKLWVNAGVIGIPANDGTPDVWYALVEPRDSDLNISLHRLSYDHVTAAGSMRRAGHANGYARAVITGIWPSHDVLPKDELEQTGVRLSEKTVRAPRQRVTV